MKTDAGDFDTWLESILASFATGAAMDVACGGCRGCCSAGRFVHLLPSDQAARSVIPKQFLVRAPGMPKGYAVMGYVEDGLCPMLKAGNCSIYASRPSTCRTFDCRVLTAAGQTMEGRWAEQINRQIRAWQFTFRSDDGRLRYKAIQETARFIRQHAHAFPFGRAPTEPTTIAVLAIKTHSVIQATGRSADPVELAKAIVAESRRFEGAKAPSA